VIPLVTIAVNDTVPLRTAFAGVALAVTLKVGTAGGGELGVGAAVVGGADAVGAGLLPPGVALGAEVVTGGCVATTGAATDTVAAPTLLP